MGNLLKAQRYIKKPNHFFQQTRRGSNPTDFSHSTQVKRTEKIKEYGEKTQLLPDGTTRNQDTPQTTN